LEEDVNQCWQQLKFFTMGVYSHDKIFFSWLPRRSTKGWLWLIWVRDVYPMCRITERSVLWYNPVKSEHYYIYKGIALFDVFHKKTADVKELHIPYYYHTAPCYRCVRKGEVIRFRCEDIVRVYEVSPN
jgi:hypothetical protein